MERGCGLHRVLVSYGTVGTEHILMGQGQLAQMTLVFKTRAVMVRRACQLMSTHNRGLLGTGSTPQAAAGNLHVQLTGG